ncbi:sugar ABC transporter ATP-binding protein [Pararobbsia alpina]|uniref:sugar ABC transporter ATP-binding protein n=1 Tax=Pararobbsia alpina TaxID=621374 RepID=UPI001C2E473A|nr:sugar ABC transporter ATP-binding protein [Pararobbsia alpina]
MKAFRGVVALDQVDFDCFAGEVHAICGENGAGKSTLMKILGGGYRPDAGEIRISDQPVRFTHPVEAQAAGISVIHQELSLLPHRSVAENIFMGREPSRRGFLDRQQMRQRTATLLAQLGTRIDPDQRVATLSIASQQLVEIAKALLLDARVVVMDEPTAALDERDSRSLLQLVQNLRKDGVAIVYISHRMPEVMAIADRVTVLKDGCKIWTRPQASADVNSIVTAMVGRDLKHFYPKPPVVEPRESLFSIENGENAQLHGIDLHLRVGEILGVAGLEDSGKAALAQAIVGDVPLKTGSMKLRGKPVTILSPRRAAAHGMGYVPADRKGEGLMLRQSVRDNALLSLHAMAASLSRPDRGALAYRKIDDGLRAMDVRAANFGQPVGALSGGNQQKTIISRWLAQASDMLVFVEPTRGIDIAAKAAIYETMRQFVDSGRGIVVISSDLPEIIGLSDRIVVMHRGAIAGELPRGSSEAAVVALSLGLGMHERQDAAA